MNSVRLSILCIALWLGLANQATSATIDTAFPIEKPNSYITKFKLLENNKILVVGDFTKWGKTEVIGLALLSEDGALDTAFNLPASFLSDSKIYNFQVGNDGSIYVTGAFRRVDAENNAVPLSVLKFRANGELDTDFHSPQLLSKWTNEMGEEESFPVYNPGIALLRDDSIIISASIHPELENQFYVDEHPIKGSLAKLHSEGSIDLSFESEFVSETRIRNLVGSKDGSLIVNTELSATRLSPDGYIDATFSDVRYFSGRVDGGYCIATGSIHRFDEILYFDESHQLVESQTVPGNIDNILYQDDGDSLIVLEYRGLRVHDSPLRKYSKSWELEEDFFSFGRIDMDLEQIEIDSDGDLIGLGGWSTEGLKPTSYSGLFRISREEVSPEGIVNLSNLGKVDGGTSMMSGFIVGGSKLRTLLIRVVSDGLKEAGIADSLEEPKIEIYKGDSLIDIVYSQTHPSASLLNIGIEERLGMIPRGSLEPAKILVVAPDSYLIKVDSETSDSGTALLEVFDLSGIE